MLVFLILLFLFSLILILYVYAGYPILIFLLGRIQKLAPPFLETFPSITLIIPAFNEEQYIVEKIKNTLAIDYPKDKFQIIIAADGSSDKTKELASAFEKDGVLVNYIPERNGKMAAITRAILSAQGEIVVFSDANNMYDPMAVRELVKPFSLSSVGATTGAKLIIEDGRDLSSAEGLYWKYESMIKHSESLVDSCVSSVGEILAIRRNIFSPPVEKIINDDHYMILDVLRRGYRTIYTPNAKSYEYVSYSAKDEVTRRIRMNAGLFQTIFMSGKLLNGTRPVLIWQLVSHKYLRAFVPVAFLLLLISNILILFTGTSGYLFNFILYLQILFYGVGILGNWLKLEGKVGKIIYIPTFLLNSNWATLLGFFSFISNRQSHIWERVRR